ncbi:glutaminyl-peptide cyclotransferase [Streptomyces sp. NPDC089799]|uniref:glutaminyl-peptide cyclotransferase n=1 Tax=Streptomyces sp. NPDC089799 TaxID=3155066 RepID=UPI003448C75A
MVGVLSRCGPLIAGAAAPVVLLGLLPGLTGPGEDPPRTPVPAVSAAARHPQAWKARVLGTLPHDRTAFTQGLEMHDGLLYEGTGLTGRSAVTAGPPGREPTRRVALDRAFFGEGITVTGDRLWQLTWRDGVAFERDATTLAERRRVAYRGEGWGLCARPGRLVMSDGSATLVFRDPETFAPEGSVTVTEDGRPLARLNELECAADGSVYANVYLTDRIVRIDPATGEVTATIDASELIAAAVARAEEAGVLNGIAEVPGTGEFLVTGKNWPLTFRVAFVPA